MCIACAAQPSLLMLVWTRQVSIPAPDPALPPSFDSDSSGHHYRFLESANQARLATLANIAAHAFDAP